MKKLLSTLESMDSLLNRGCSVEIHSGTPVHDLISEAVLSDWEVIHTAALDHLTWLKSHHIECKELEEALQV